MDITQQIANGIMAGSIYGLLAVSLALVFGVLEVPQFAFGAHAMFGAYAVLAVAGLGYWAGVATAIAVGAILGLLVQALVFDPLRKAQPATLFIAAFGLLMLLQGLALLLFGPNPRTVEPAVAGGTHIFGAAITYQRLIVLVVTIVAVVALNAFLRWTSVGRSIRAAGQSTTGSLVVGLNPRWIGMTTMALGSALACLAGALLAPVAQVHPTMGDDLILKAFIVIIIAGMGSINGALIAGLLIGVAEAFGSALISVAFRDAYAVIFLIAILVLRPQGLFGRVVRTS